MGALVSTAQEPYMHEVTEAVGETSVVSSGTLEGADAASSSVAGEVGRVVERGQTTSVVLCFGGVGCSPPMIVLGCNCHLRWRVLCWGSDVQLFLWLCVVLRMGLVGFLGCHWVVGCCVTLLAEVPSLWWFLASPLHPAFDDVVLRFGCI